MRILGEFVIVYSNPITAVVAKDNHLLPTIGIVKNTAAAIKWKIPNLTYKLPKVKYERTLIVTPASKRYNTLLSDLPMN